MKDIYNKEQEDWKVLLSQINQRIQTQGITYETIAERTGFRLSTIGRILHASFSPKLSDVLTICQSVGIGMGIQLVDHMYWIEIDDSSLPENEVLAANFGSNYHPDAKKKLVGKLRRREEEVLCESDDGIISGVTHYMRLPESPGNV